MRLLFAALSFLSLIASTSANAEIVQCTASAKTDGQIRTSKVTINYEEKYVEVNGMRDSILATASGKIEGVQEFLKAFEACMGLPETGPGTNGQLDCTGKALDSFMATGGKGVDPLIRSAQFGIFMLRLQAGAPEQERMTELDFDLAKIASVRAAQIGKASAFGIPSVLEYQDESGTLLGRYMIAVPLVISCK